MVLRRTLTRDRLGRKITPASRRAELVAGWRASGQTQAEFARREGIKYSSFASWVQAERRTAITGESKTAARKSAVRFAEVRLPTTPALTAGLEVRLADGTVLWGGDARELAILVRALRG